MAATADRLPSPAAPPNPALIDQRVLLSGVAWSDYQRLLDLRGDRAGPRMTYLEGVLELMSPSVGHESLKKQECMAAPSQTEALSLLRTRLGP